MDKNNFIGLPVSFCLRSTDSGRHTNVTGTSHVTFLLGLLNVGLLSPIFRKP